VQPAAGPPGLPMPHAANAEAAAALRRRCPRVSNGCAERPDAKVPCIVLVDDMEVEEAPDHGGLYVSDCGRL
jgi:hypothetical protein